MGDFESAKEHVTIVRVKTEIYTGNNNSLVIKKSITPLKRKCKGYNVLTEEMGQVGAEDTAKSIINLDEVEDGTYELVTTNHHTDWETGYIDGWDLKLVPYKEKGED